MVWLWQTVEMKKVDSKINPFLRLRFIEFFAVQILVMAFFPVSLLVCWLVFGGEITRFLIDALLKDWIQTTLITLFLLGFVVSGVIWMVVSWIG